jgi:photosynthetic reaction center cytochrome c subunit
MNNQAARSIRLAILGLTLGLTFAVAISRTSTAKSQNPAAVPQQKPPAEKTVDEMQKNIQVLKGLPESQLLPVMNYMSASLGVRCVYCHVNKDNNWDFPSDEKGEKASARKMITMVMGINKNSFNGNTQVGCYTCHRGRTSPAGTLPLPLPEPSPRPESGQGPQREALPTADQLLEKYTQALGGSAAIEKLKSRVMKGTVTTAAGVAFGYELYQSGPDKVLAVITPAQQPPVERGFNGTGGWEKSPRGIRDLVSEEVFYLHRYPNLLTDIKLKDQFSRLAVAGKDKINGRDVYIVRGTTTDNRRERLFFDVETGLLLRRTTSTTSPVGIIPEQVDFEDYREVDGMKMPFTIRVSAVDPFYSITRKFTEIKLNAPVDEKRFNKPA